jgi:hypothetical protein
MTCRYFRFEVFRQRWKKLILRRDDDTRDLMKFIPLEYRDVIR